MGRQIFIPIPALNEKFTEITVKDAYEKADKPENIYFGIFNQKTNSSEFENFSQYKNVKCVNVSYKEPLGLGLARLAAATLLENQDYFLQIDAHTIFAKGWDTHLIEDIELLSRHFEKPLISQSIVWHDVNVYLGDDQNYIKNFSGDKAYPLHQEGEIKTHPDTSREQEEKLFGKFLEHYLCYGGGGLFGRSEFLYEISYNPFVMFDPEQELTALRASTRGYKFFSSDKTVISSLAKDKNTGFTKEQFPDDRLYSFNQYSELTKKCANSVLSYYYGERFGFWGAENKEVYNEYNKKKKIIRDYFWDISNKKA